MTYLVNRKTRPILHRVRGISCGTARLGNCVDALRTQGLFVPCERLQKRPPHRASYRLFG
jgi:hypothetical protein